MAKAGIQGCEKERPLPLGTDGEERQTARKTQPSHMAAPHLLPFGMKAVTARSVELRKPSQGWGSILCRLEGEGHPRTRPCDRQQSLSLHPSTAGSTHSTWLPPPPSRLFLNFFNN